MHQTSGDESASECRGSAALHARRLDRSPDDRRIRVMLFVMPFASPASVRHAQKLVDCLAAGGNEVRFIGDARVTKTGVPHATVSAVATPTLHYLGDVQPRLWSVVLWVAKLALILTMSIWALIVKRHQTDAVVCFLGTYYWPILVCARFFGIGSVYFEPGNEVSGTVSQYGNSVPARLLSLATRITKGISRRAATVCAIESLSLRDQLGLTGYGDKVQEANLYVDTVMFRPVTPFECRPNRVAFIGRLSKVKGARAFVEAAALLADMPISFSVVGDGPERRDIEQTIAELGLKNVTMTGWLPPEGVIGLLNDTRLVVLPSAAEGMPNTVLEAMACGTPVLATPIGAIPDVIIPGATGFTLCDREPETLAGAIRQAFEDLSLPRLGAQASALVHANYSLLASSAKWRRVLTVVASAEVTK